MSTIREQNIQKRDGLLVKLRSKQGVCLRLIAVPYLNLRAGVLIECETSFKHQQVIFEAEVITVLIFSYKFVHCSQSYLVELVRPTRNYASMN